MSESSVMPAHELAAVSAAVAQALGTDAQGLRIHSIRKLADSDSGVFTQEMAAAVSACVAQALGTEVSGIRLLSVKRR